MEEKKEELHFRVRPKSWKKYCMSKVPLVELLLYFDSFRASLWHSSSSSSQIPQQRNTFGLLQPSLLTPASWSAATSLKIQPIAINKMHLSSWRRLAQNTDRGEKTGVCITINNLSSSSCRFACVSCSLFSVDSSEVSSSLRITCEFSITADLSASFSCQWVLVTVLQ